jgi:hypothetical protein
VLAVSIPIGLVGSVFACRFCPSSSVVVWLSTTQSDKKPRSIQGIVCFFKTGKMDQFLEWFDNVPAIPQIEGNADTNMVLRHLFQSIYAETVEETIARFKEHIFDHPALLHQVAFDDFSERNHSLVTIAVQENCMPLLRVLAEYGAEMDFDLNDLTTCPQLPLAINGCQLPIIQYGVEVLGFNVNASSSRNLERPKLARPFVVPVAHQAQEGEQQQPPMIVYRANAWLQCLNSWSCPRPKLSYLIHDVGMDLYHVGQELIYISNEQAINDCILRSSYTEAKTSDYWPLIEHLLGLHLDLFIGNISEYERNKRWFTGPQQQALFRQHCRFIFDVLKVNVHSDLTPAQRKTLSAGIFQRSDHCIDSSDVDIEEQSAGDLIQQSALMSPDEQEASLHELRRSKNASFQFIRYLVEEVGLDPHATWPGLISPCS